MQKWELQLNKVLYPYLIIEELNNNEQYGYLLIKKIELKKGIDISEGAIYSILLRLKKEGYITERWVIEGNSAPRKYYKITKSGVEFYKQIKIKLTETFSILDL